jgi:hypothetical protein
MDYIYEQISLLEEKDKIKRIVRAEKCNGDPKLIKKDWIQTSQFLFRRFWA